MTVGELLRLGISKLKSADVEAPALEAGVILCYVLNCDKTYLYVHGDAAAEENKAALYQELLCQRCEGLPMQYITGVQEFMSLDFKVTRDVLIPRQDTEILVEAVIEYAKNREKCCVDILDIGTGSGCIAVSLAHYLDQVRVTAVDISERALEIARINSINNNVSERIEFIKSNIFSELGESCRYDIVASNPPYIPAGEIDTLKKEVREHEPMSALVGGGDGLCFYRTIITQAPSFLKPGGMLAFEVGYNQAEDVSSLMQLQYSEVRIQKDLTGMNRVVLGFLKPDLAG